MNLSYGISTLVLVGMSLGGALPAFITSTAHAAGAKDIYTVSDLRNAIENQANGETWNIHAGNYGLSPFTDITAGCPTSCQKGWYLPITADNLTINGIGNPTIYGTGYTANGNWATQDFVAIFGDNVTLNDLTLMPKVEPNKTIEVMGSNSTIKDVTVEPNTLDTTSYGNMSSSDQIWAKQWGGSIYYNNATGTQTLENVTVENGGISDHSPSATINLTNVKLNYATNVDWINGYRLATHGNTVSGAPLITYHVNNAPNNLDSVLANIQNSDVIELDSDLTTSHQITLTKSVTFNGNGHTVSPDFAKTDNDNNSAIGIQTNDVTINNLVEDGTHGTSLHGINVYQATGVILNDVDLSNNAHSGLNVNGSKVTVNNLSTTHNGWGGVDVDKTGAVLTVNGTSHHDETSPDIYVDSTSVGTVIDTNHQYSSVDNVKQAGDRVYKLNLGIPTVIYPANNGSINTNDFWFDWSDVTGAHSYEFQTSQSPSTTNGVLNSNVWTGDYQHNQPAASTLHSVGANGTWYWQVRTVDAYGIKGAWSPVWKMTIDMVAPNAPTNLAWKTSTNVNVPNNGYTNVYGGAASWQAVSDANHYIYKYWNDITGNQWKVGHEYTTTTTGTSLPGVFNQGEGVHYFCVEAVDAAGNTSPCSATFTITYDKTAPVATITAPSNNDLVHGTVAVSGTVTDTNPDHYYFVVKDSHGTVKAGPGVVNQATVASWSWDTTKVADGVYTIDLEARDKAGNKGLASTATITVTVDNTAPTATIDAYSGTDTTPTITGTVDDPTAGLTVSIDGGTAQAATNNGDGTWSFTVPTALSTGTHTVVLTATDAAGNSYSTSANVAVTAAHASVRGLSASNGNGNSNQATGHQPTVTVTPNNDGHVLGVNTTTPTSTSSDSTDNGKVKGASTEKTDTIALATNTKSGAFLGLGWWWLVIIAVVVGFFAVLLRKADSNAKN